jgi:hypothetical protein
VLIQGSSDPPRLVRVGIDAAIVAQHEVCIRATDAQGRVRTDRFRVQPTLAGLRSLSNRLAEMPGVVAVAEPTSMTWLGLSVALRDAGCDLSLLGGAACLGAAVRPPHGTAIRIGRYLTPEGWCPRERRMRQVTPAVLLPTPGVQVCGGCGSATPGMAARRARTRDQRAARRR